MHVEIKSSTEVEKFSVFRLFCKVNYLPATVSFVILILNVSGKSEAVQYDWSFLEADGNITDFDDYDNASSGNHASLHYDG